MKQRNPLAVFLLPFITLGIYSWYWLIKTKGEMNKLGEEIPTAWIWLIPFVGSIWWLWKYSEGVEHVSNEKLSGVISFILIFLLGNIGQAIIQDTFNKLTPASAASDGETAAQPVADAYTQPVAPQVVDQSQTQYAYAPPVAAESPAPSVDQPVYAAPAPSPAMSTFDQPQVTPEPAVGVPVVEPVMEPVAPIVPQPAEPAEPPVDQPTI